MYDERHLVQMPHVVYDNLNYEHISSSTAICSDVQFT